MRPHRSLPSGPVATCAAHRSDETNESTTHSNVPIARAANGPAQIGPPATARSENGEGKGTRLGPFAEGVLDLAPLVKETIREAA